MGLYGVISTAGNIALPVAGTLAGCYVAHQQDGQVNNLTGIAILAGGVFFGTVTALAPGERSHQYIFGTVMQIAPLVAGIYVSEDYDNYRFKMAPFILATAVSLVSQIFLRELVHLPETFRSNPNRSSFASPLGDSSGAAQKTNRQTHNSRTGENSSTDIIPYGVSSPTSTLSMLVPTMENLSVAGPGRVIIGFEQENTERRHFFEGNTTERRRKYLTAEGGTLDESEYRHSGWLGSESRTIRQYRAGSESYGSVDTETENRSPLIEEIT